MAMLKELPDGTCKFFQNADQGIEHEAASMPKGKNGLASFDEHTEVVRLLEDTASKSPKSIFRARRLPSGSASSLNLRQVQRIKRGVMKHRFSATKLHHLEEHVAKHRNMPAHPHTDGNDPSLGQQVGRR